MDRREDRANTLEDLMNKIFGFLLLSLSLIASASPALADADEDAHFEG